MRMKDGEGREKERKGRRGKKKGEVWKGNYSSWINPHPWSNRGGKLLPVHLNYCVSGIEFKILNSRTGKQKKEAMKRKKLQKNSSIVLFAFLHREIFSSKKENEGLNWFFLSRIKSCELQTDQRKIFFNWGVLEESGRGGKNLLFESRRGREEGRSWILGRNSHHSMMIQWVLECSSSCYSCSWSSSGSNCSNCRTTTSDPSTWMRTTKVMMGKVG